MKKAISFLPTAVVTFLIGTFAFTLLTPRPNNHTIQVYPTLISPAIHLEIINVRDPDVRQRNLNSEYLSMFDAVYFDQKTILALYSQDGMRTSNDGGKTWESMFVENDGLPKATGGFTLWGLDFVGSKYGWAYGNCLIKTNDGGQSWTSVRLPEWIDDLQAMFLDENTGYVAGRGGSCERGSGNCDLWMSVYKTDDGGKSWRNGYRDKNYSTPWLIRIIDSEVALMLADGNDILRTQNGGRSWSRVYARKNGGAKSLAAAPDGRLWVFGQNNIIVSDDLGKTWRAAETIDASLLKHDWWSVDFTQDGIGVAVSEDAAIALTRDGGNSWKHVTSNLHVNGKIPVPDDPFDEALRRVKLNGRTGIVMGSQRDYLISLNEFADD